MIKLESNLIWQWILVLTILYTMINGIDWIFDKNDEEQHKEEMNIERSIEQKIDELLKRVIKIEEKLNQM